jgi:hypothetical protein
MEMTDHDLHAIDNRYRSPSYFEHKDYSSNHKKDSIIDDELENVGEPITITIPTENIDQLQDESDIKQVSLNTRINQVIKDHLDWHSAASDAKMYYIPKQLITRAVDHLTEQELSEFAQSMVSNLQDMSLLLRGEFNFSSFLDIIKVWLRITRTPNRFEQGEYEHKIVIRHDMGYRYSYLIKEVFKIVMYRFNKHFHYKITDNTILIRSAN